MSTLTDEQAVDLALSFNQFQRQVILLCGKHAFPNYRVMADTLDVSYDQVREVGSFFQTARLAFVQPVRDSLDNYAGSALFLNEKGQQVRHVIELQEKLRISK